MKPERSEDSIRHPAVLFRRLTLAMGAAAVLLGAGGSSHAASALDRAAQPSLPPAMEQRFEAPVGHRQPTAQDVPSGVLQDEGATSQNQRELDKKLDICRGC